MSENVSKFNWSKARLEAAQLLAADQLTDREIAAKVGISDRQLWRWKKVPEFQAKVKEIVAATERGILSRGIAARVRRVQALNDRWDRMRQVIAERGADPGMQTVAGGKTGLLVHQVKGVGKGEDFQLIDLYLVDTGLLKELREHEKQAAQELGQWVQKVAPTSPDGEEEYAAGLTEQERGVLLAAVCARLGFAAPSPGDNGANAADGPAVDRSGVPAPSSGDDGRPVATPGSELAGGSAAAPLFPASGKNNGGVSPGVEGGHP